MLLHMSARIAADMCADMCVNRCVVTCVLTCVSTCVMGHQTLQQVTTTTMTSLWMIRARHSATSYVGYSLALANRLCRLFRSFDHLEWLSLMLRQTAAARNGRARNTARLCPQQERQAMCMHMSMHMPMHMAIHRQACACEPAVRAKALAAAQATPLVHRWPMPSGAC